MPGRPILVSACLLGECVRYDGGACPCPSPVLARWVAEGRVIPVCPEVAGGLSIPRPPAEQAPDGRVVTREGQDLTPAFRLGADHTVARARACGARLAILKEGSPSCGVHRIHDGSFSGRVISGEGLTARALREAGLRVLSEADLAALLDLEA